jgi:hypothetical protein
MRKIALTALAAFVLGGAALASTGQTPRLRVADSTPLTVTGVGFKSHERVRIVYSADQTSTRHTTATAAGTFTARFVGVAFQACKLHRLWAVGSLGSKAVFRMPPVPCAPPTDAP